MQRIPCPWCGLRDEAEFQYGGDATGSRPPDDAFGSGASDETVVGEMFDFVYRRDNPKGWQVEWWHHVGGCRLWVKVVRHTVSHEIHATGFPDADLELPET